MDNNNQNAFFKKLYYEEKEERKKKENKIEQLEKTVLDLQAENKMLFQSLHEKEKQLLELPHNIKKKKGNVKQNEENNLPSLTSTEEQIATKIGNILFFKYPYATVSNTKISDQWK
jgi:predicted RNase H-like nuclease (RuvC/YqgF family)